MSEISIPIVEALPTTEPPKYVLALQFQMVRHFYPAVLRGAWTGPNFTKLGRGIGQSFIHEKLASDLRYLASFSNACDSNLSDVLNDAKFCTF